MENKLQKITFLPDNKTISIHKGMTILQALEKAGIHIDTPCGGEGICGKCKVLLKKAIPKATSIEKDLLSEEEIKQGFRLACQIKPVTDIVIKIPQEIRLDFKKVYSSDLKGDINCINHDFTFKSNLKKVFLALKEPSLDDQKSDWERIKNELSSKKIENISNLKPPLEILKKIPGLIREANYKITVTICDDELIDIERGNTIKKSYGMAFDIGTTTAVGYLVDLESGEELSAVAKTNPQIIYGDDVISRIGFSRENEDGLEKLQKIIVNTLNEIIAETVKRVKINKNNIYKITIAGNTCMHHLLLGIDPSYIAPSPYIPVIKEGLNLKAKDIPGFTLQPNTNIYVLPNISAFVGADISAGVLATGMWKREKTVLFVDLGTNGEIVLGFNNKLWTCSTAAGPAFEGARIGSGMRAAEGAIDRVKIDNNQITYHAIKDGKARGICGSGLIDLIAEMLKLGFIDKTGRLINQETCNSKISEEIKNRIIKDEKGSKFLLVKGKETENGNPIFLTQKDIRELQLAKAAIFAGIKILLKEADIFLNDIDEILLAGAFGNFINKESAGRLGLIPPISLNKVESVGNAAGRGAEMTLLSEEMKKIGRKTAKEIKYIELSSRPDFQKEFVEAIFFNIPGDK
ncbi:MAG: ASKHA domain-containing protein [Candidatus Caldatribacteriota bacterium]|nr:ASKHA domain-containing protein [Candidatus Caldatribacteriota bacterium]